MRRPLKWALIRRYSDDDIQHAERDIDPARCMREGLAARGHLAEAGNQRPAVRHKTRIRGRYRRTTNGDVESMIVTASLTTGVARVTHGMPDSVRLIDEILRSRRDQLRRPRRPTHADRQLVQSQTAHYLTLT
jgi:hypothetical protein